MIVTRSWLQEYIDISDIDNDTLNKRFNEIGLEVDSFEEITIPSKVVVGEIKSCSKHPDADKLNICQIDVGNEVVQIVCGASNVVNAQYVAVATVGSVLPGNFKIKKAKLRGVESLGMVCSSTELGLPELEDGIMILDDSIGELVVGRELNEYKSFADTVIELELTANRGDCQNIHGVARDLAAAFNKDIKELNFEPKRRTTIGVAKGLHVDMSVSSELSLEYTVCKIDELKSNFLQRLRLAFTNTDTKDTIDTLLKYARHSSGCINRAYDFDKIALDGKATLSIKEVEGKIVVLSNNMELSTIGVNQNSKFRATDESQRVLLESSYINPELVVDIVSDKKLDSDDLYYYSSRGSEPDLNFGMDALQKSICSSKSIVEFSNGEVYAGDKPTRRKLAIKISDLIAIIGNELKSSEIVDILKSLGFNLVKIDSDSFGVEIPLHAHDIKNNQDLAEEIMRIYGIDNIKAKPSILTEKNRINATHNRYKDLRDLRQRAVGSGFYEALTYIFANKDLLSKYQFDILKEDKELLNPIVKELNTLRSTILVNLLESANRNSKYGKKSIALFEEGTIFNSNREQRDVVAFIFSGEYERASILNSAKPKMVEINDFVTMIGGVIGEFNLVESKAKNGLMHPYISALVIKDNKEIGFLSKLHPVVAKEFNLKDTFIAELDLEALLPKHINVKALSNFQAVNKDLSIVVDSSLSFYNVAKVLQDIKDSEELLRDFYPLDIYSDDSLKDKKSLTIRFTMQSDSKTLSDAEIESVMDKVLSKLTKELGAELR